MPIVIFCPDCTAKIRAPEQVVGRQIRCPKCDAEFTAIAHDGTAATPDPPPPPAPPEDEPPPRSETIPAPPPVEKPDEEEAPPPPPPAYAPGFDVGPNPLAEFLLFRVMIAPLLIQFLFWMGVIVCVVFGGYNMISAIDAMVAATGPVGPAFVQALAGLGLIVFGPLVVRLQCEVMILFFRIYDVLKEILAAAEKR